ncbi:hypothetical protein GCM10010172_36750 [Paractinoplanes ferrugineus]|uniref:Uncharacterized protein n=1 Tax=Paractinoplanes ferrugineus TaxID=113564 RepID=A0A919MIM3_9ACTN|nr:hypothetical protein [Actinoplanes ferrugineus]GIE09272.1 hypothetical protein Afe05nite_11120 [Actinoplanes ferrugineus]
MRSRAAAVALLLLAVAGCDQKDRSSADAALPPVDAADQPAASAGGACILWDYPFIAAKIGVKFEVAASGQVDDTSTCVVQTVAADYPDLTLSVVESTQADAKLFDSDLKPAKATAIKGLGKAGYRLNTAAAGAHGPVVEIGWLSEAKQLQTLRFTFAKTAAAADVPAMNTKLLELAKAMDTTAG